MTNLPGRETAAWGNIFLSHNVKLPTAEPASRPLLIAPRTGLAFIGGSLAGVISATTPGKLLCVVREKGVCKLLHQAPRCQQQATFGKGSTAVRAGTLGRGGERAAKAGLRCWGPYAGIQRTEGLVSRRALLRLSTLRSD